MKNRTHVLTPKRGTQSATTRERGRVLALEVDPMPTREGPAVRPELVKQRCRGLARDTMTVRCSF
jgi:hypothetical protein